ncbi:hypothetical protein [Paenibacillus cremeus]|uniref:Uncharacterized protein n=1 Tax=Paenibacillus cremeus TaxID=2163881 RepID=A0A559KC79_9BACL|nr:hypothetical protein [Paenibacillus cremeus]TVY09740.1 hypothetical protein FPZ49_11950 [Paenibacillus cremeus]
MNGLKLPNDKVTIELSVKEAMALAAGVRFHEQTRIAAEARKKVLSSLESILIPESNKIHYQLLEV